MLHTFKSNSLTILTEKLAGELARRVPSDPLQPIEIIVPNLDTSRWLKLILSEETGIVANCRFILPAEWQFRQIRKKYEQLPSILPSDPAPLTWAVFDLLMDDEKRKQFSRPDQYIRMQPTEMKEQAAIQLAVKIGSVFDQYIVYRPQLITGWQHGKISSNQDERWQAKLWNQLEKERKKREKGTGFPNKAELSRELTDDLHSGEVTHPEPVYLFNTGLLPVPIIQMVQNLSDYTDVLIFRMSVQKEINPIEDAKNPLFRAYGEEARGLEMLYGFSSGKKPEFFTNIQDESQHFLKHIQKSILEDKPIEKWDGKNNGIEIHSCHTPLREIEVLHQFLLRQFEKEPALQPDDVLVVTPDLDTYKPFIHAVFGTHQEGLPAIPYHTGFGGNTISRIKRVVLQLLEMVDSRFTIAEVLDLFMETAVREQFDVSESGGERIARWMKENNVIWGLDKDHRRESGQPESELHTWKSAMRRGWKGMVMGSNEDPFEDMHLHYDQIQGRDREENWSSFSAFINKLREISTEVKVKRSIPDWCELTDKMMCSFCTQESLKDRDADQVRKAVEEIRQASEIAGTERKVSYSLFRSQIRDLLQMDSASTAIFTRGVTFSSMVPVRSIPAKIIALIGLNESEFPRKPKYADFDLMARHPEPTDRNRKNEDRNLFLESIMAAGDVHYCSFIGRSRVDNEPIPPSPVVSEWISCVSGALSKKPNDIVIEEPLHGFSAANFSQGRSFAKTEYLTSKLIRQNMGNGRGLKIEESLPDTEEYLYIGLPDLVRFYSNPVSFFFKSRFNPGINIPDEQKKEFTLNELEKHKLFEQVFGWRLYQRTEDQILKLIYQSGAVPEGWQGENILQQIIFSVDQAIALSRSHGFEPEITDIELDIELGNCEISGSILSYSGKQFLDITSSSFTGAKAFKSWIYHLCAQLNDQFINKTSHFLCDLKKVNPLWITFKPCNSAEEELKKLIKIYQSGNRLPLLLFPATAYEYQKGIFKGQNDPESKAAVAFEGSDHTKFSENRDLYLSLIAGEEPDFETSYIEPEFQSLMETMLNHMDPVK